MIRFFHHHRHYRRVRTWAVRFLNFQISVFSRNLEAGFLYIIQFNPQSEENDIGESCSSSGMEVTRVTVIMGLYSCKLMTISILLVFDALHIVVSGLWTLWGITLKVYEYGIFLITCTCCNFWQIINTSSTMLLLGKYRKLA
jgi:hypothetical protein